MFGLNHTFLYLVLSLLEQQKLINIFVVNAKLVLEKCIYSSNNEHQVLGAVFILFFVFFWLSEIMAGGSGKENTHNNCVGLFLWITWLFSKREGPLLPSSGTALERLLLCGKHYDIMQVDLIDLMEQADVAPKPTWDEKQAGLGNQNHSWNEMLVLWQFCVPTKAGLILFKMA